MPLRVRGLFFFSCAYQLFQHKVHVRADPTAPNGFRGLPPGWAQQLEQVDLSIRICIHIHVNVHVHYIYMYIDTYTYAYIYIYICTCTHTCTCTCTCTYTYTYTCTCPHTCIGGDNEGGGSARQRRHHGRPPLPHGRRCMGSPGSSHAAAGLVGGAYSKP